MYGDWMVVVVVMPETLRKLNRSAQVVALTNDLAVPSVEEDSMIPGTPYHAARSGDTVTVRFATADSTDLIVFDCENESQAFTTMEMWQALIYVASQDPANNVEDEDEEDALNVDIG